MQEFTIKCTKISFTGWKNKEEWKLHTMKIQGAGVIIFDFIREAFKVNETLTKEDIEIDELLDFVINEHEAIKISSMSNKEIKVVINDIKGNFAIGVTIIAKQKIEFVDITKLKEKYRIS